MTTVGNFQIQGELERGAGFALYQALHTGLNQPVLLRVITAAATATPQIKQRIVQEATLLRKLSHPSVQTVLEVGEAAGQPYVAMEMVQATRLGALLAQRPEPLPVMTAAQICAHLAGALEHCHAQGVVHRDVALGSVLLRADGVPLLTDFGYTKDADPSLPGVSQFGRCMGTPGYCAPEQASGQLAQVGPHSDVYGLGAVLYTLLVRQTPIRGGSPAEILAATVSQQPAPPSSLRADVPPALEQICLRCLAKAPAQRFASASELKRALDGVIAASSQDLPGPPAAPKISLQAPGPPSLPGPPQPALGLDLAPPPAPAPNPGLDLAPQPGPAPSPGLGLAPEPGLDLAPDPGAPELADGADEDRFAWQQGQKPKPSASQRRRLRTSGRQASVDGESKKKPPVLAIVAVVAVLLIGGLGVALMGGGSDAPADSDVASANDEDAADTDDTADGDAESGSDEESDGGDKTPPDKDPFKTGLTLLAKKDYSGAITSFTQAVELDGDLAAGFHNRGNAHYHLEDYAAAYADFSKAVELRPKIAEAYHNQGAAAESLGKLSAAISAYDTFLKLEPEHPQADGVRADVKRLRGELKKKG